MAFFGVTDEQALSVIWEIAGDQLNDNGEIAIGLRRVWWTLKKSSERFGYCLPVGHKVKAQSDEQGEEIWVESKMRLEAEWAKEAPV